VDLTDYISLRLISLQFINRNIYEEILSNKIEVQVSTLSVKYLKFRRFHFFNKSSNIKLLNIIGGIILLVALNSSRKLK
jgi:hypothetical protein